MTQRLGFKREHTHNVSLAFETDDTSRLREYLKSQFDVDDVEFERMNRYYNIITNAKKHLGIKE